MYLIFSEEEDRQTNEVIDRLLYYKKEVVRYNQQLTEDEKKGLLTTLGNHKMLAGRRDNNVFSNISIFHRRPSHGIIDQLLDRALVEDDIEYPKFESESVYFRLLKSNYIAHQIKFFEAVLNDPSCTICKIDYRVNKYEILVKAANVGICIPPTLISGDKKEVIDFYKEHDENIITKSLYEIMPSSKGDENFHIKCYTQKVEDVTLLSARFFPTLFQKNIEKKYELRVFYLDGRCYSAAILSQINRESQQDFRNADRGTPNRVVPYNLSAELTSRIVELMQVVGLNTGSLDFIVGSDGEPYFLEINPIGQYGWINTYCNFEISDALAKKMIQFHGE